MTRSSGQQTIQINVSLHKPQAEVHRHPARFKVVDAGRRWGKTLEGTFEAFEVGAQGKRAWWVAPSYKMTEVGWRPLRQMGQKVGAHVYKDDRVIEFPNGGLIAVRSADTPDSLRSEGLDFVVFDEAAYAKEEAWTEALRPSLADRKGRAMFLSTPNGKNWYWRLWLNAASGDDPEWAAWQFPTSTNPFIDPAEIEAARRSLPERVFRQEFLAEFIDDAGAVFRNIHACVTATRQDEPIDGHQYIVGADWAKYDDFTSLSVLDVNQKAIVYIDRFNMLDYAIQVGRLKALCERFRPQVVIAERNSMGEPLVEQLLAEGLPIQPFLTTSASKQQAVDALSLALERQEIGLLDDRILIAELQAYEATRLPSGMLRYSAPSGSHDDVVTSVMLAWQGIAATVMDVYYASVRLR